MAYLITISWIQLVDWKNKKKQKSPKILTFTINHVARFGFILTSMIHCTPCNWWKWQLFNLSISWCFNFLFLQELLISAAFALFLLFELIDLTLIQGISSTRNDCIHFCRFLEQLKSMEQRCEESSKSELCLAFKVPYVKEMWKSIGDQCTYINCQRIAQLLDFQWTEAILPAVKLN